MGKGCSIHPWDAISKLGASWLSVMGALAEGSSGMLSAAKGSIFGNGLGLILQFLRVGRSKRWCLCRMQPRRGQHSPRIGRGAGKGCPGEGPGEGPRSIRASLVPTSAVQNTGQWPWGPHWYLLGRLRQGISAFPGKIPHPFVTVMK